MIDIDKPQKFTSFWYTIGCNAMYETPCKKDAWYIIVAR